MSTFSYPPNPNLDPNSFRLRYLSDMVLNTITYTMYILANKLNRKQNSLPSSLVVWGPLQICLISNWLYLLKEIIWHFIHGHLEFKNVQNFENKRSHEFSYNLNVTLCTTWGLPKRGNLILIFTKGGGLAFRSEWQATCIIWYCHLPCEGRTLL